MIKSKLRFDFREHVKSYKQLGQFILAPVSIFLFAYYLQDSSSFLKILDRKLINICLQSQNFYAVLALFFVGIYIESTRWKVLIASLEEVTTTKAIKAFFLGSFFGSFMPNRIGEFGGRLMVLKGQNQIKSIPINMAGGFIKFFVNVIFGLIGLLNIFIVYRHHYLQFLDAVWITNIGIILLFVLLYFLKKNKFLWRRRLAYLKNISSTTLSTAFLLSLFRYLVFTSQFILLLNVFGLAKGIEPWRFVYVFYLFQTINPVAALFDLGIRSAMAEVVFSPIYDNIESVLLTISFLWVLNILVPAVVGGIFLLANLFIKKK